MNTYLNESFAKVYDHGSEESIVVLEWGTGFIWSEQGQKAVNTVLKTVKENKKKYLLAHIVAEGFDDKFLDWLVNNWYTPAQEAGLSRIAHKMGNEIMGQLSAEQVAEEDISGILFRNFYSETEKDIVNWLLVDPTEPVSR